MAKLSDRMRKKLAVGLTRATKYVAEQFTEDVDIPVERPLGLETLAIRSVPGEFPRKDTGEGQSSIAWAVDYRKLEGAAGVTQDGLHLFELAHDPATVAMVHGRRKFIDDTFLEHIEDVKREFILGAGSV